MNKVYRVTAEWLVKAKDEEEAINIIENAVASSTEADLEDSEAEYEYDEGDEEEDL